MVQIVQWSTFLKIRWQESLHWESKESFDDTTRIRPVNFNTEHQNMLSNLHAVVSKGYLAIDPKYDKLLISRWNCICQRTIVR